LEAGCSLSRRATFEQSVALQLKQAAAGILEPHREQPEENDQSYEAAAHNKTPIIPDRLTAKAAPDHMEALPACLK
jgi:hypothetical protein